SAPTFVSGAGGTFDPADVSAANNTVHLGTETGLKTGDRVLYNANGGTAINPLTDRSYYFVRDMGAGNFKLFNTQGDANSNTGAIDLTSAGTASAQSLNAEQGIESSSASTLSSAQSGDRSSFKSQGQVNTPSVPDMNLTGNGSQKVDDDGLDGVRTS